MAATERQCDSAPGDGFELPFDHSLQGCIPALGNNLAAVLKWLGMLKLEVPIPIDFARTGGQQYRFASLYLPAVWQQCIAVADLSGH